MIVFLLLIPLVVAGNSPQVQLPQTYRTVSVGQPYQDHSRGIDLNQLLASAGDKLPSSFPVNGGYAAPQQGYAAAPQQGYAAPQQAYGAPQQAYAAPQQAYGAPQQAYAAPQQAYGAPQQAYAAPQQAYGAPQQVYAAPQQAYAAPQQAYGAPQQAYGVPQQPYAAPQQAYAAPQEAYAAPQLAYGVPQQPYAAPQAYAAPQQAYAAPQQAYGAPQQGESLGVQAQQHGGPNAFNGNNDVVVKKQISIHVPPPEAEFQPSPVRPASPPPKREKHYKIIFIKAPEYPTQSPADFVIPPPPEHKTLVYVLVKKPAPLPPLVFPTQAPTVASKPEVYFIRYRAGGAQPGGLVGPGSPPLGPATVQNAPPQIQYGAPIQQAYAAPAPGQIQYAQTAINARPLAVNAYAPVLAPRPIYSVPSPRANYGVPIQQYAAHSNVVNKYTPSPLTTSHSHPTPKFPNQQYNAPKSS